MLNDLEVLGKRLNNKQTIFFLNLWLRYWYNSKQIMDWKKYPFVQWLTSKEFVIDLHGCVVSEEILLTRSESCSSESLALPLHELAPFWSITIREKIIIWSTKKGKKDVMFFFLAITSRWEGFDKWGMNVEMKQSP